MPAAKDFYVAIELGSSKITGIAAQKKVDGSITVLAIATEEAATLIRKGMVYNIDKTNQCIRSPWWTAPRRSITSTAPRIT